jgi:hypothetical protein
MPNLVGLTVSQYWSLWNGDAEKIRGSYLNYTFVPPAGTTAPWSQSDVITSESPLAGTCDNSLNAKLYLELP